MCAFYVSASRATRQESRTQGGIWGPATELGEDALVLQNGNRPAPIIATGARSVPS